MTIIAYKDGIMAADTQTFSGDIRGAQTVKIVAAGGRLYGASGDAGPSQAWRLAMLEGRDTTDLLPDKDKRNFTILEAGPDGVWQTDWSGRSREPDAAAIGAGWEIALGAMHAGASAEDAVRICIAACVWCGGDVTVLRLPEAE